MTLAQAGSLDPQGPAAEAMADLWWLMLWLGVGVFVVFAVLLGVGLFRGRTAAEAESVEQATAPRLFVGAGVVVPLLLILIVFVATIVVMRRVPGDISPGALTVEIVGHQWWYEVSYPEEGITARNELHMPVGRPVEFRLTSADVIHSFWVPALGGKMDMLPDGINTLVLQADEPGEHLSLCAEFCGLEHAEMRLAVVAEPEEEFAAWVTEQQRRADVRRIDGAARTDREVGAGRITVRDPR